MKGYQDLTERQRRILHKHSIFDAFAGLGFSKKQKAKLEEDIAYLNKYRRQRELIFKSNTESQSSKKT